VQRHRERLSRLPVVATRTTGVIEAATGMTVRKVLSGPLGGDPLTPHPHEPDISALMKICDTHNVPLATNLATAEMLLDNLVSR
jgi:methylglyoxal synthase